MTVLLLRHGRSTSNTAHTLAGRSEGVDLDDRGREQAAALVERLAELPIRAIVRSPLLRCERTVEPLAAALGIQPVVDERIIEVDYGSWTGRTIGELVKEPLWAVVQQQPSAAVFPEGEGLAAVQARAVAAVREHDRRLADEHGGDVLWIACTHGDVIKSVLADALGTHLDSFQRINADPASVSVIRYTPMRPFVIHVNHTGAALNSALSSPPPAGAVGRRARYPAETPWSAVPPAAAGILETAMAREIHVFRTPDRFVAGTVGQPGNRTFYLQAVHDKRVVSVMLEKQQVAVLAERIAALLLEINRRFGTPIPPETGEVEDLSPLITPVDAEFRVGTMGLGWDSEAQTVVVELLAVSETEFDASVVLDDAEEGPDAVRVFLTPESARQFAARSNRVISAGRPPCPLCEEPLDPEGHICVRTNGYRRGALSGSDDDEL